MVLSYGELTVASSLALTLIRSRGAHDGDR